MPPELLLDPARIDLTHVLADQEAIRRVNPQRYEMEQLTAIVQVNKAENLIIGYKDVRPDEFWVRGHMPDEPLMPGVVMCEAAAQLCAYFVCCHGAYGQQFIGLSGLENVRFRAPVRIGDRLVLVGKALKVHRRQMLFSVQGFVNGAMVFHADVIGVPLNWTQPASEPGTAAES
jgi:3-hydroxyacyl-[acyl-carrier-protein] dehydratase